jgi:ribosome biogenesis GTPase
LTLESLGWNDAFADAFRPYEEEGLIPARVAVQHRGGYVVLTEEGEREAEAARRQVRTGELAGVGDWVALRVLPDGRALVEAVLPRQSAFTRKETMDGIGEQILAANVDTVFLVSALGHDLNLRRIERYLTAAWDSGAAPVVVLTKADLHPDTVADALVEVESVAFGVPVHAVSNVTREGLEALGQYLGPGKTVALLGSSGVGKSTLVNTLLGEERLATGAVREDDERGRHTTTHRELVQLPGGALLLDTPGMRELQLYADGRRSTPPSRTSPNWPPSAASRTAPTCTSPAVPSGRRSRTGGSIPTAGTATGGSRTRSARSRSVRTRRSSPSSASSGGASRRAGGRCSTEGGPAGRGVVAEGTRAGGGRPAPRRPRRARVQPPGVAPPARRAVPADPRRPAPFE